MSTAVERSELLVGQRASRLMVPVVASTRTAGQATHSGVVGCSIPAASQSQVKATQFNGAPFYPLLLWWPDVMAAIHTMEVELLPKLASRKLANIDKGDFLGEWHQNVHRHPDRIEGHDPRYMVWRFTKKRLAATSAYCRRGDFWDRTGFTSVSSRRSRRTRRHASAILMEYRDPDIMRFLSPFADGKDNLIVKRPCSKTCTSTFPTSGLVVDDMK